MLVFNLGPIINKITYPLCILKLILCYILIAVPVNYQYLSETSILRPLVDTLVTAGKLGAPSIPKHDVTVVLRTLINGPSQPLPPLNWAAVLSPLLRVSYGQNIHLYSFKEYSLCYILYMFRP